MSAVMTTSLVYCPQKSMVFYHYPCYFTIIEQTKESTCQYAIQAIEQLPLNFTMKSYLQKRIHNNGNLTYAWRVDTLVTDLNYYCLNEFHFFQLVKKIHIILMEGHSLPDSARNGAIPLNLQKAALHQRPAKLFYICICGYSLLRLY